MIGQFPLGAFDQEFLPVPVEIDEGIAISDYKRLIVEDKDGVIWMATNSGVVRYDGFQSVNFTQYLKRKFPDKVVIDDVMRIALDSRDQLWMGTFKGLSMYNLKSNTYVNFTLDKPQYVENFRNKIIGLIIHDQDLYISTFNGLYILDIVNHQVKETYLTSGNIHSNRAQTSSSINGVYPNVNDSLIYVQANDGMHIIDKESKQERVVTTDLLFKTSKWWDNSHWFYQGEVMDGKIITGTYNTGIAHFDMEKETYDIFLPDPSRKLVPNQNIFKSITALKDSLFILAAINRGLLIYDYSERTLTTIKDAPYFENAGFLDSYGHYWIGRWGALYRSKRALGKSGEKHQRLQIGQAFSNDQSLGYVSLENIELLKLEAYQSNLKMFVSLTQGFDYDSLTYEYNYCGAGWKPIPNQVLLLENIGDGNHSLKIRVSSSAKVIDNVSVNIYRHIPWYQKWYNLALCLVLLSLLYYLFYRWRLKELLAKQQLKNAYELEITKLNTAALRSRMNPHFLFNTLNSIKHHALFRSKDETSNYITAFSELIRGILEYSTLDQLSLEEDMEWIKNYIHIEMKRFKTPFEFLLSIDPDLDLEEEKIPPLLIQPYVENAIWHGLLDKSGSKSLILQYRKEKNGYKIIIIDNGVGRKHASELKGLNAQKKKSLGMEIITDRINYINALKKQEISVTITDLNNKDNSASGTKVSLSFLRKTEES